MLRKTLTILIATAFALSLKAAADTAPAARTLSATEIVDRNVAARGGLQAWRAVETMTLAGKMGADGNQRATLSLRGGRKAESKVEGVRDRPVEEVQLPFVMDLARPHKSRVELQFKGQTAIQVYDGTSGWKLRPFLNRVEVEPYYRDYRNVNGLEIPFLLETRVLPVTKTVLGLRDTPVPPEKAFIEKVVINPKFDAGVFSKPVVPFAPKAK